MGGGITSKSLSEIPNNIKSMLTDNYKKIAIIDYTKTLVNSTYEGQWANKDMQIDISFVPNRYFVITGTEANFSRRNVIDSKLNNSVKTAVTVNSQNQDKIYLTDLGDKKIRIHYYNNGGTGHEFIIQIIAIE